jgi:plasmid replication initiation protein
MQQNILTFREWNENHVKVNFILGGGVKVFSFDKLLFNSSKKETVQNFNDFQQKELLNLYKKHFNKIQKKYTKIIEDLDIIS